MSTFYVLYRLPFLSYKEKTTSITKSITEHGYLCGIHTPTRRPVPRATRLWIWRLNTFPILLDSCRHYIICDTCVGLYVVCLTWDRDRTGCRDKGEERRAGQREQVSIEVAGTALCILCLYLGPRSTPWLYQVQSMLETRQLRYTLPLVTIFMSVLQKCYKTDQESLNDMVIHRRLSWITSGHFFIRATPKDAHIISGFGR